jgi:hypothetical protein
MAVWEDHLLPRLRCMDAARLGSTCKVLRGVVRETFRNLGSIHLRKLQAALTTFPNARSVAPYLNKHETWELAEGQVLVEWLRRGRHGEALTTVTAPLDFDTLMSTIHSALGRGALPSLKGVAANLYHASHRALLTEGRLGGMHELHLKFVYNREVEPQLAALGLVLQLPALAKLHLEFSTDSDSDDPNIVHWPSFIPPNLTALRIVSHRAPLTSLLRALPGMLGTSGAGLECLEIDIPLRYEGHLDERLLYVAQALRRCSPTLKAFQLNPKFIRHNREGGSYHREEFRLQ